MGELDSHVVYGRAKSDLIESGGKDFLPEGRRHEGHRCCECWHSLRRRDLHQPDKTIANIGFVVGLID